MLKKLLVALALTACSAPAAHAGARQQAIVTMPDDPAAQRGRAEWGYADAVVVGDTAYLSGLIAMQKEGEVGPEAAYERMFTTLGQRLQKVGCSWDDVVEMTSFHTDLASQLPAFLSVKSRYVRAPFPAWTAVGVTRLVVPNGITEMKLVARACHGAPAAQK